MPSRPRNQEDRGRKGLNRLNMSMDALNARYVSAEARVTSLVARAVLGGTLGTQKVRKALKRDVIVMLDELNKAAIPDAMKIVEQAYELGRRLADAESTGRVDDTALKLLKDGLTKDLDTATATVGRRVDDVFRKAAIRSLAQSPDEDVAILNMEKILQRAGLGSFQDRTGRIWSLSHYAGMAVKTTQSEATFTGTLLTLQREGLDLVDTNTVRNPCSRCKPYDGGTFSLSGRSKEFPLLDTHFPVHPECQHFAFVSRHNFDT